MQPGAYPQPLVDVRCIPARALTDSTVGVSTSAGSRRGPVSRCCSRRWRKLHPTLRSAWASVISTRCIRSVWTGRPRWHRTGPSTSGGARGRWRVAQGVTVDTLPQAGPRGAAAGSANRGRSHIVGGTLPSECGGQLR